jgi:hypothetical protein
MKAILRGCFRRQPFVFNDVTSNKSKTFEERVVKSVANPNTLRRNCRKKTAGLRKRVDGRLIFGEKNAYEKTANSPRCAVV